jgi:hypothetical protein
MNHGHNDQKMYREIWMQTQTAMAVYRLTRGPCHVKIAFALKPWMEGSLRSLRCHVNTAVNDATWTRLCHMTMVGEESLGVGLATVEHMTLPV